MSLFSGQAGTGTRKPLGQLWLCPAASFPPSSLSEELVTIKTKRFASSESQHHISAWAICLALLPEVWAARELCTHFDASPRCVQNEAALMTSLASIAVRHSTLPAWLHQHSSFTCGAHNLRQQLSCCTEHQTPSWGGRCTCRVGTAPHSHLSQELSCTTGRYFAPSSSTVALGCSCCRGTELPGFCSPCAHLPCLTLVPMHPCHSHNTSHSTDFCSTQSNATCGNSVFWKSKATHP